MRKHEGRARVSDFLWLVLANVLVFPAIRKKMIGANLKALICGSAPLSLETQLYFMMLGIPVLQGYGLTETTALCTLDDPRDVEPGRVGPAIPGVEMKLGENEEIVVRGPNIFPGYWNRPEETAKVLRDGWLYTGDVGYGDADGYFFITDRKKDMLLVNGINVYPREIEEVIYQFPGVKEAAVVGLPDPRKGEQPVAFVVAAEGQILDEKQLLQFVRGKLADYKVPKRVVFMPALPHNATGKILKTTLRKHPLH